MGRSKEPVNYYNTSRIVGSSVVAKPVTLQLPNAHPRQFELISALDDPTKRFIVGACGTKFGKTYGSTIALVQNAWNEKDSLNWWVSPTFAQSKIAYELILRLLPKDTYWEYKADMRIVLLQPDNSKRSTIEFKSGDNPGSLRGFGVNFFVMDEAARCLYDSYVSLMTTVTQTMGRGFFISTPFARNWFYDVYQKGVKFDDDGTPLYEPGEDPDPEWFSIRMPTWSNPHVPLEAIRQLKKNMPEDVYRQEVAAQFLQDSAGVFRRIKDCIRGSLQERVAGKSYVMGVDLARLRDYTVITVMDKGTRHVVYHERFNHLSWEVQYQRIIQAARKYNASAVMDSTGIGDPIVETIHNAGIHVIPYKIGGSAAKQQLIEKLRINIENEKISFPYIPVLKKELEVYEYKVTDSNQVKYDAPHGMHDDCVISLALANWGVSMPELVYRYRSMPGI
jgi:hypothetical protein